MPAPAPAPAEGCPGVDEICCIQKHPTTTSHCRGCASKSAEVRAQVERSGKMMAALALQVSTAEAEVRALREEMAWWKNAAIRDGKRAVAAEAENARLRAEALIHAPTCLRCAALASTRPAESWRCSECGDVLTVPEKRLPKVCENCHSRIPFVKMPFPPPIRVAAAPGAKKGAERCDCVEGTGKIGRGRLNCPVEAHRAIAEVRYGKAPPKPKKGGR